VRTLKKMGCCKAGLPDFSWYNIPKREKYTKLSQNIPNDRKMLLVAIQYTTFSIASPQNKHKLEFLV
jgi:hypothetical protein